MAMVSVDDSSLQIAFITQTTVTFKQYIRVNTCMLSGLNMFKKLRIFQLWRLFNNCQDDYKTDSYKTFKHLLLSLSQVS